MFKGDRQILEQLKSEDTYRKQETDQCKRKWVKVNVMGAVTTHVNNENYIWNNTGNQHDGCPYLVRSGSSQNVYPV
jgi:hypothetical protein